MKILLTGARELRCAGARLNAVVTCTKELSEV